MYITIEPQDEMGEVELKFEYNNYLYLRYYGILCIYSKIFKNYIAIWEFENRFVSDYENKAEAIEFYKTLKLLGLIGRISDE